jgi:hypothetical protein
MDNINFVDAIIEGFLNYELDYFKSGGLSLLVDKPKYTSDLDFDVAFIDDDKIRL